MPETYHPLAYLLYYLATVTRLDTHGVTVTDQMCWQGADGDFKGVHTFMSVGNSSFFTSPVAATIFPMAPVVFSATTE